MPSIKLFELGPTRSARVRWMLLEAERLGSGQQSPKLEALIVALRLS
jgi:hypothetical protein